MKIIKRLFCKHEWELMRVVYGDEILHRPGRYGCLCKRCGKWMYRKERPQ